MTDVKSNRFTKYFPHVLDALRTTDLEPMRPADVIAWVRERVAVPEEDTLRKIVNGRQTIFENDVHWGRFYLAKAGLIASPKHGLWSLTPAGRDTPLTPASTWDLYVRVRDANRPGAVDEDTIPAPETDLEDDSPSFWFAGAVWDRTEDQTERFRTEHVWINGNDDKVNKDLVALMKRGDRIAIMKFTTVDLSERPQAICHALRQIVAEPPLSQISDVELSPSVTSKKHSS